MKIYTLHYQYETLGDDVVVEQYFTHLDTARQAAEKISGIKPPQDIKQYWRHSEAMFSVSIRELNVI